MTKTRAKKKRSGPHRSKRLVRGPNGGIELLLIQPVEHLGRQGDVVEVRPGYAHNYLLPQGLATMASEHHRRMVTKHKAQLADIERARLADLHTKAEEMGRQSVTIEANANDEGHLYGSVGAPEIVAALKRNNVTITQDQVRLQGPLKELGLYTVKIHVGHEIEGEVKVWVVPSVGDEDPAAAVREDDDDD
ncbi:MAG: 50S ribosomal protein L9 [Candidatus Nealsonbacteria bacterium]|nr:50S ribosomal protein L9 [Candidatus Nealsonbacteria bacterium]